jgi:hypothetical protein
MDKDKLAAMAAAEGGMPVSAGARHRPRPGDDALVVTFRYTNHRGETATRRVIPQGVGFLATEWHPEPQWLLHAYDLDRGADRSFALAGISGWSPAAGGEGVDAGAVAPP